MAQKTAPLLPVTADRLQQFGARLRLARLRRKLTAKQVAERAGMTAVTLRNLERGGSGVTIGAFLAVMQVLGVERDLDLLAQSDSLGRELQDAALPRQSRKLFKTAGATQKPPAKAPNSQPAKAKRKASPQKASDWTAGSDFVSADSLAALIKIPKPGKGR
jgi:transcriptional regulator with XRE-family HTH domain